MMGDMVFTDREDPQFDGRVITASIVFRSDAFISAVEDTHSRINLREFHVARLRSQVNKGILDWLEEYAPDELERYRRRWGAEHDITDDCC